MSKPIPIGSWGRIPEPKQASDGSWCVRARYRDPAGVVRQAMATGATSDEAYQALLTDLREKTSSASGGSTEGITPSTLIAAPKRKPGEKTPTPPNLIDEWLAECALRHLSSSTMRIYRSSARLYLAEYMAGWTVRDATAGRVDALIKRHVARGLDTKALRTHLNQLFDVAVRHGALPANPVTAAARVKHRKPIVRAVENAAQISEIRALIERWETGEGYGRRVTKAGKVVTRRPGPRGSKDLYDFFMVLAATGDRPGEVLALRWQDIHLEAERPWLEVTGTIKQESGVGIYRQAYPKTPTSIRRVELPPTVAALLWQRQFTAQPPKREPLPSKIEQPNESRLAADAVFPSQVGTWQSYSQMYRRWSGAVKGSKYEWVTFKVFRKSIATLIANEHDLRTAQHQLGHASEKTTQAFYDAGPSAAPQVAETIEAFISGSQGRATQ